MKILVDLFSEEVVATGTPHAPDLEFDIKFKRAGEDSVYFDGLSFEVSIRETEEIFQYPLDDAEYFFSDQEFLESGQFLGLVPGESYTLDVKVTESGKTFEKSLPFTAPLPEKPFESWTYSKEAQEWIPPKPYPEDEKLYVWLEDSQEWEEIPDTMFLDIPSD